MAAGGLCLARGAGAGRAEAQVGNGPRPVPPRLSPCLSLERVAQGWGAPGLMGEAGPGVWSPVSGGRLACCFLLQEGPSLLPSSRPSLPVPRLRTLRAEGPGVEGQCLVCVCVCVHRHAWPHTFLLSRKSRLGQVPPCHPWERDCSSGPRGALQVARVSARGLQRWSWAEVPGSVAGGSTVPGGAVCVCVCPVCAHVCVCMSRDNS